MESVDEKDENEIATEVTTTDPDVFEDINSVIDYNNQDTTTEEPEDHPLPKAVD